MKYVKTNIHPVLRKFLLRDEYDHPDGISATGLAESTRVIVLKERHKEEITSDYRMGWRAQIGTAVHAMMEDVVDDGEKEERLYMYIGDQLVSGKFDLLIPTDHGTYEIHDYKTTQPYQFEKEKQLVDKEQGCVAYLKKWQKQMSVYKLLLTESKGIKIESSATIHCFCMNWDVRQSKRPFYPKFELFSVQVPLLDCHETLQQMRLKVEEIAAARLVPDFKLPDCTSEDTWEGNRCCFKQRGDGRWQIPWCPVYKWCGQRDESGDPVDSGIEFEEVKND